MIHEWRHWSYLGLIGHGSYNTAPMYNGGLEAIITATYAQTSEVLQCKGSMSQNCYHIPYSTMRSRCILHMSPYTRSYYFPQCLRKVFLFPFGNIRARRTYFCFHGASFPFLKTEVSCQTDLLRSIVTLKNASSHFFSAMMFPVHPGSGLLPHAWDVWTTQLCSVLWIISRNTCFYEPKGLLIVCPLNTSPDPGTECPVVCYLDSNTYCMVPF